MKKKELPLFKVFMSPEASEEVPRVLQSGFIGQGAINDRFEKEVREKFNHPYINTTNSATSAEHLAFQMLKAPFEPTKWAGLGNQSEVLVTALSCLATHTPIIANGLKIKFVDLDPLTLNIDLDDLERKITSTTRVINLVHWSGIPNNLQRIREIQNKTKELFDFKPAVVEDGAHALGAKYQGKYIGTHGNLVTFSLQAIKTITSIDGGLLFCPNYDLFQRSRLLRWYGLDRDDPTKVELRCTGDAFEAGHKFHMNDLNAQVGSCNFKYLDSLLEKHRNNAKYYDEALKNTSGITLIKRHPDNDPSYWIYSLLVERREDFHRMMKEAGIFCNQVHERVDTHTCMKEFKCHLPNLDFVMPRLTNLPVGWWVEKEDLEYVASKIKGGW